MRCKTLKATADKLGKLLDYYAGLAEDRERPGRLSRGPVDYYLDPDEPPGQWWGSGRSALGLDGEVTGKQLRELLDGRNPTTGAKLGRKFGAKSARGFDCTFSAPKSISVLWALTPDPWVRAEVLASHEAAVEAALGWFEDQGAVTRRGTDGVHQVDTRGITAALFRQHTSRTIDPQLHTHAIVSAKVQDPTGKWLSLDARFLKQQQTTIGWVYDAALRAELTARLDVDWRPNKEGRLVDLAAVPEELCDVFSERSAQVEAEHNELIARWSAEHDGEEPDPYTVAKLERRAVKASRPPKSHGIDAATLHDEWIEQATVEGFDRSGLTRQGVATRTQRAAVDDDALIREALGLVQEESATWLRADIVRHLTNLVPPSAVPSATEVVEYIDRLATRAENCCVEVGPTLTGPRRRDGRPIAEAVTDRLFTTNEALDQELHLQQWAEANAATPDPAFEPRRAAVKAITGFDRLVVVVGPAGTGKTKTTAYGVETLGVHGRPVVGLAPSGKAADVLATEAGCPTDTLAGFLTRHQHIATSWPAGTTVILDEASMAATDDIAHLVDLVERNDWRLVAIGDPAQLPAVGRGGVFAHWCETVPHIELETPRRFRQQWEAEASLLLRAGDPKAAEQYAEHGRVRTVHPAMVPLDIARTHQRHAAAGRTVAITTNTAETARAINLAIQRTNAGAGVRLADGTTARAGDQIATRRNDPNLRTDRDEKVRNRHTWTVTDVDEGGSLTVTHPDRGQAVLPARYVAQHVELGWAVTGYGNQGDTVDVGITVLEPGTTRNHAYVAMTRGRQTNLAVITDPTGTADPAEALTDMIGRTPRHDSALAVRARLHREAGVPEPPIEPAVAPMVDDDLAAKVRATQQRLDALQARSPGGGLSL
ncbi:MAG: relaxase domain-containing protein [Acidimicrobiales bacterium]|nr:relaxase domain-containing protein [Acidimicrobiales bacterium]